MAEPPLEELPDTSLTFSSIAIPPLSVVDFCNSTSDRQALLGNSISDLIENDGDGDFDFTFADSIGDLYFPSENESFFTPLDATNLELFRGFTPASGISGEDDADKNDNGVLISTSASCDQESPKDSDCSDTTTHSLSSSTPELVNYVSHILEATNASSSLGSAQMVIDQKLKVEEEATTYKTSIPKRRKEIDEEDTSNESWNNKYRRMDRDGFAGIGVAEDDQKRNVRLIRNRESAHLSRQRKRHYVEELEDKVKIMHSTICDLNSKMSFFMAENVTLRHQVSSGSNIYLPLQPRPGIYSVPYPCLPYPAYMVKPQGSQVALLPIPRLKPQQSVAKVKKFKKVASFSVLGILFCLFLFGALAPIVNISYKSNYVTDWVYDQSRGRVLDVNGYLDVSVNSNRAHCGRDSDQEMGRNVSATETSGPPRNSSEPLVASLFVPRNDKLVKIDGNLIIHSITESEKSMATETKNEGGKCDESTTNKGDFHALPLPDSTKTDDMSKNIYSKKRKALSSSGYNDASEDQLKSTTTANGKMQQWFREGVAVQGCAPAFFSSMSPQPQAPSFLLLHLFNSLSTPLIHTRENRIEESSVVVFRYLILILPKSITAQATRPSRTPSLPRQ
ncbi:bZIP transcription factor 49 isoform X2 [Capsella rubella]|uniref:bZIP transcription factor 49 isoform X2 n=1 Tax=Capsella rubella TaxID=81985 RepID=UPI000CD4E3AB|nr:bZIP transcription factor 49 isoform X2 [Capsella rubella]